MITELLEMQETKSLPEMCARFGDFLGIERPVPEPVLLRALDDAAYASDLITCRGAPAFLEALFDQPRTRQYAPPPREDAAGNLELVGRAATAFLRWGKAGFSTVDEATLERRESACLSCPHLSRPTRLVQKLAGLASAEADRLGSRTGDRVCAECGCNVGKKMKIPGESCPVAHPTLAGLTRWGEPIPSRA